MKELSLLETSNPLEERLGKSFFEKLPKEPGIYKMYGREGMLLYIGKAKNLRRRLFSYRLIRSHNSSRKEKKLVRMIRRITYEVMPSEEEALLQENKLIRKHNPPFNRAKSSHKTYYFLSVVPKDGKLVFDLRMHLREELINSTYGAFKGYRLIRKALGALLRQLYLVEHEITTPFQFPLQLINKLTPMHYKLQASEEVTTQLYRFLEGRSDQLLYTFVDHARSHNLLELFIGKMILKDMESLRWFYRRATSRNRKIINRLELKSHIIPQEKLDDYLVRLAFLKNGNDHKKG